MFKIEPAEWRDTFRIRCNKNPHELYEVSAITTDGLDNINSFRTTLGEALSQHDYTAADKLADLLKIVTDTRALQKAYFRNRLTADLEKSKLLERKLDALVLELGRGEKSEQGKLF